jgi:predicted ATPase
VFVSHLSLRNWRNFRSVDVELQERTFIVGANASGKSNMLDVFRFVRDIAQPGGGLQKAVSERGGFSRIRCLAARRYPDVEIEIRLIERGDQRTAWRYAIGIKQQPRGDRKPILAYERVWQNGQSVLDRPDSDDREDEARLTQTHLEQISANARFRELARFLETVCYLHLVPQLVRHPREFSGPGVAGDPFGRSFLERIAKTPEKTRKARLRSIEEALRLAVPQLKALSHVVDAAEGGVPHLEAVYEHWRPHGAKQRERDFSDGTLRLVGLFWSLLESDSLLLLEEPELSLNNAIISRLPSLIHRSQRKRKRQVLISTHSSDLLSDRGIGAEEVLLLTPGPEGTTAQVAARVAEVTALLRGGLSVGEATLPRTRPRDIAQLELWS